MARYSLAVRSQSAELLCCSARMEVSRRYGLLYFGKSERDVERRAAALVFAGKV